ncbi:PASTA domain-containing protein [Agriterribacter sp.]|uniref:PASTA domain-containing protein n=1 Tax=Agriterribacter sp. TaxID=2821509 RepID=UPI002CB605EA|nr:PASTA domain-containing protein [Agriterribacter sp.]HRO46045.1 PASTA domain-containing protein [Agriterribacter sp.]HRQ17081.1 PASTA domain-containing protein [Agriterribacter sp.]
MFTIITRRPLWVNILVAVVILFLLVFIFFQSLQYFTHHGTYLKVPDVGNKNIKEATALLNKQGFDVWVQDSVYYDTLAPLAVVKQFPEPDASVKVNRIVYLTVNRAVPPVIEMPNLVGMSFRNAELELKARGLKLGDTSYKPDIAKNAVLEQSLDNKAIKPGTKITMGATIALVLGAGIGSAEMPVPDLFGMNYEEAITLLEANGIIPGSVIPDGSIQDTGASFVFRQQPERYNENGSLNRIRRGQMIDVWISANRPVKKTDSTQALLPNAEPSLNEY